MPSIALANAALYYERAGAGDPLLLIQGMSGTHLAWGQPFLDELRQSFEVISFDNRGIGLSQRIDDPFTVAEMAEDTAALLEALQVESAHVLGISMGGMIAQELALSHPEMLRSLALGCSYCGGLGSQLMPAENLQKLAEGLASGDREKAIRASYEVNLSPTFRADEDRYAAFHRMATDVPAAKRTIELQVQAIVAHDTSARLGEIGTPTLVIHGSDDGVLPFPNGELIASLIPNARLEAYDGAGHMFWWEQPQRSANLIRAHALAASRA